MLKTMKPLYPKPHRNQLLEGLRPTLELNTFHRWPGVSCSPLPQGLHQVISFGGGGGGGGGGAVASSTYMIGHTLRVL